MSLISAPPRLLELPTRDQIVTNDTSSRLYRDLRRLITDAHLLTPRPRSCLTMMVLTSALMVIGFAALVRSDQLWQIVLVAAFLGVAFAQIGLVGHDIGHGHMSLRGWRHDALALILGNLVLGLSASWWVDQHNRHHRRPNQENLDPDIGNPVFAFSSRQARLSTGFRRWTVRYQAYLIFPVYTVLASATITIQSIIYLLCNSPRNRAMEAILLLGHYVWYIAYVFLLLGPGYGICFMIVQQGFYGLYIGLAFGPNHKGMPVLAEGDTEAFLIQQTGTARNVHGPRILDWLFGGLNYQIEHHLFPNMPRRNLCRARPIVREFCLAHALPYHETGIVESYRELLSALHALGRPLEP